jgi:HEPN domain-containing protein
LKFKNLAEGYREQARIWFKIGRRALKDGDYNFAVLAAQECVEFSIKGLLRSLSVESPKYHDVSQVLSANKELLPRNVLLNLNQIIEISSNLALQRTEAAYGNEETGTPPSEIFNKKEAELALQDAAWVKKLCMKRA